MNDEQREKIKSLYEALNPALHDLLPFPPSEDDGEGAGSDKDLASIIEFSFVPVHTGWGPNPQIGELQLEFAIKLGRALERAGVSYDQI